MKCVFCYSRPWPGQIAIESKIKADESPVIALENTVVCSPDSRAHAWAYNSAGVSDERVSVFDIQALITRIQTLT